MKYGQTKAKVVLISGAKFSGKSTVAKELHRILGMYHLTEIRSFAYPFKRFLVNGGILTEDQAFGSDAEKRTLTKVEVANLGTFVDDTDFFSDSCFATAREVLQIFGNDIMKKFKPTIWVDMMNLEINRLFSEHPNTIVIIDDFRFYGLEDNLDVGGIFKIHLSLPTENKDKHISENSVDLSKVNIEISVDKSDPLNFKNNIVKMLDALQHFKG